MQPEHWWIIAIAVLIGHYGLHLAIYNRINALGWRRQVIKAWVKVFFLNAILLPPLTIILSWQSLTALAGGETIDPPPFLTVYGSICLAAWFVFGIPWLLWRPIFALEWVDANRKIEVVDVQHATGRSLALTPKCTYESQLPLNQIFDLAIEQIELPVVGLPQILDGYRIAHITDVHLTGDVHPDYARYAIERASDWKPSLIALTGDIIDKQPCVDWLVDIFSPARAPDGCYFVLGNHDTRIIDSWQTREGMDQAGWTDLGSRKVDIELAGVPAQIIGNEYPWFRRPQIETHSEVPFRLLLSHSPDQFGWARQHNITLMLAGHTHGGQGRIPFIGPLLSPSLHGTRYASGDFYRSPTTMHVSRGIGGVHLMRINCRPELSLLTLRAS